MYLLALIAVITCFISGLWIGYTSKGLAIVEGVLAGAAVTVVMAMTNMLTLYRKLEDVTVQFADSMGLYDARGISGRDRAPGAALRPLERTGAAREERAGTAGNN